ncbi:putative oxidoreductase, Zn-dependent and NAD(P)-binding protein [Escherichia coli 75]|nr:putative oxidoreductase, Zn-dependent and NAD(P)-binding protein [Escherichia coli 75]
MKALARFGKAFGGYKMIDVPQPMCGPEDVVIEIKAAAICGADMKHYNVDSGSDEFNSIRGHEFAGCIAQVGEKVKDWKVGQRVVSDNSGHVCGVCPACEQGDFLCCTEKVNLGLDNNTWGGGFSKYCLVPGEILKIHRHALWEIPDGVDYEDAAVLDPICNAYKSIAQQSKFLPGQDVVVIGTGPLGLFSVQMARIMGGGKYRRRWSARRCGGPLPGCKRTGCDGSSKWFYRRCGGALPANLWQRQSGTGD